jgi:50S ribosomal subunit-associated GTPase HflX
MIEKKLAVCLETIERIGASGIPLITALNKTDLLSEKEIQQKLEVIKEKTPNPIPISALRGTNLGALKEEMLRILESYVRASFTIPLTNENMSFISTLFKDGDVKSVKYADNLAHVILEADPWFVEKVRKHVKSVNGKFEQI